jgi:TetR/AcrR family transcriptional regulator
MTFAARGGRMSDPLSFERARNPTERAQRREQILAAAGDCLMKVDWREVTVAAIARRAGLGKGTAYRYFSTKEELFLELVLREITDWSAGLEAALARPGATYEDFATRFARSLAERTRLTRLLGLLHGVIEHNVPAEAISSFKRRWLEAMRSLGETLETYDVLEEGRALQFLLRAHAVTVGLAQLARPSVAVAAVIAAEPDLAPLAVDFEAEMRDCLAALAR